MRSAYLVADIRAAEAALMAQLPPGTLMQRAAAGLAGVCLDLLGDAYGRRVVMLIGSGDNGGDALYAGALLARRGVRAELVVLDPSKVHADGLRTAIAAGARLVSEPLWSRADLLVDAIVGIGGKPGLREPAATHVAAARSANVLTVAVDVPSGVDVDAATTPEPHVHADLTVTFGAHKPALLADPAASAAGVVRLVDIGLSPHLDRPAVELFDSDDVRGLYPRPAAHDHKYTRGVVGVDAGSSGYAGAGVLCVLGARAGPAGMVRYAGPEDVARVVVAAAPEVVVGRGRVQAWVVGSGGGSGAEGALEAAADDGVPLVVDADALLFWRPDCGAQALLTPHAGELARMLKVERSAVEAEPLAHVRRAAEELRATVLLKGHRTLVAEPGGPTRVVGTGDGWLATAGAGDVLAGLAGSLLAAGLSPIDAGSAAAWLHGTAATAAAGGGPITASDVAKRLPRTTARLLAH